VKFWVCHELHEFSIIIGEILGLPRIARIFHEFSIIIGEILGLPRIARIFHEFSIIIGEKFVQFVANPKLRNLWEKVSNVNFNKKGA
jgi:hypothetical protein